MMLDVLVVIIIIIVPVGLIAGAVEELKCERHYRAFKAQLDELYENDDYYYEEL